MDRRTAPILLLGFVNVLGGTLLIPVLPFVVRDLGQSDVVFALLIAAYPAAQFLAAPVLGQPADHRGRRPGADHQPSRHAGQLVLFVLAYFVGDTAALTLITASRIVDELTGGNAAGAMYAAQGPATLVAIAVVAGFGAIGALLHSRAIAEAMGIDRPSCHEHRRYGPIVALSRRHGGGHRTWGMRLNGREDRHHGVRCRQGAEPLPELEPIER